MAHFFLNINENFKSFFRLGFKPEVSESKIIWVFTYEKIVFIYRIQTDLTNNLVYIQYFITNTFLINNF